MPELKPLKLMQGDILYQERDLAEEIYFIKQGKVKLNIDIAVWFRDEDAHEKEEEDDDEEEDEENRVKNIAFISYTEGSHFGDADIFGPEKFHARDSTAISSDESHFFVLSNSSIQNLKRSHREIMDEM